MPNQSIWVCVGWVGCVEGEGAHSTEDRFWQRWRENCRKCWPTWLTALNTHAPLCTSKKKQKTPDINKRVPSIINRKNTDNTNARPTRQASSTWSPSFAHCNSTVCLSSDPNRFATPATRQRPLPLATRRCRHPKRPLPPKSTSKRPPRHRSWRRRSRRPRQWWRHRTKSIGKHTRVGVVAHGRNSHARMARM